MDLIFCNLITTLLSEILNNTPCLFLFNFMSKYTDIIAAVVMEKWRLNHLTYPNSVTEFVGLDIFFPNPSFRHQTDSQHAIVVVCVTSSASWPTVRTTATCRTCNRPGLLPPYLPVVHVVLRIQRCQSHLLSDAGGPHPNQRGSSNARHIDSALLSGWCMKATNCIGTVLLCSAVIGTACLLAYRCFGRITKEATISFVMSVYLCVFKSVRL
jgi:hypothetical protein